MRRLLSLFLVCLTAYSLLAEQRIYLVRGGSLPEDVTSVDLRPETSDAEWALRNIYAAATARYALFEKQSDSWWQVATEWPAYRQVDLSQVTADWTLCIRLRRTVDYSLTLTLGQMSTSQGFAIPTSQVPADGSWRVLRIPLRGLIEKSGFSATYNGRLFRLHSDLGFTGDEVGIDFCYLTNDASHVDEGGVLPEKRYYLITNDKTPRGVNYDMTDLSSQLSVRYSGWMQWSYVPFPYYSMDNRGGAAMQLCAAAAPSMQGADDDWALIGQVQTDMQGPFSLSFYLNGKAYTFHVDADEMTRNGSTWNRLYLPLDEAERGTFTAANQVLVSLRAAELTAGHFSMASLMLTNNHSATDPDPIVPGDPASGQQIWLLNDGTPLPVQSNIQDYRLFQTDHLNITYNNNTTRKAADSYLTLLPTNGWWSVDITAAHALDMTAVQSDWTLHTRIRTTCTHRPINIIVYAAGNQEMRRYQLTDALLPVAQNGTWVDIDVPMSTILGSAASLPAYSQNHRVLALHADNGGTSGVEVSMEYFYFAKPGESTPAPIPGETPLAEPDVTPLPDGLEQTEGADQPMKVLIDGRIYIRYGDKVFDVLGRLVR